MLIEVLICSALAILAGAMADQAEKANPFRSAKYAVLLVLALGFCVLALWTGLNWALQFKGVI